MLNWLKRRVVVQKARRQRDADPEPAERQGRVMSGKYLSLYNYLDKRYATTVVLSFGQIEDLLGFALPDLARLQREWWTNADPDAVRPSYSDSWLLANRTATPNLLAGNVVFERGS